MNCIQEKTKYIFANWKMNKNKEMAITYYHHLQKNIESFPQNIIPVLLVPFPFIDVLTKLSTEKNKLLIGAQNVSPTIKGALTGEVSAQMIRSVSATYCLVGHSERRRFFFEEDKIMPVKITRLLEENITPILCIGENIEQHKARETTAVLAKQLSRSLRGITIEDTKKIIIAYEPLWAIGTGLVASTELICRTGKIIRQLLSFQYGDDLGLGASILYGGSVNKNNIVEISQITTIDGVLVGGASLSFTEMSAICKAYLE